MSDWTEREFRIAGRMIRELRKAQHDGEAMNAIALVVKAFVEAEPRRALFPNLPRAPR